MIKLDITSSTFIHVPIIESDQWMEENVGKIIFDSIDGSRTVGDGWKLYFNDDPGSAYHGRWYLEFESENHAAWFKLRWL